MINPKGFWLASYPKSGNTWVRLLLHAYRTGVCDINNMYSTMGDVSLREYASVAAVPMGQLSPKVLVYYRQAAILNMLACPHIMPAIIKTHSANTTHSDVSLIPGELTTAAVYLVRDPRDVCYSFARHMNLGIDSTIVQLNREDAILHDEDGRCPTFLGPWSKHVQSWENDYTTIIKYEDLKTDPEANFERILDTFKIKLNRPRLRKAIRLTELSRLKRQEERDGFNEKGKSPRFFGQGNGHETDLDDKQIRRIEEDHREVMLKYGYRLHSAGERTDNRSVVTQLQRDDRLRSSG